MPQSFQRDSSQSGKLANPSEGRYSLRMYKENTGEELWRRSRRNFTFNGKETTQSDEAELVECSKKETLPPLSL